MLLALSLLTDGEPGVSGGVAELLRLLNEAKKEKEAARTGARTLGQRLVAFIRLPGTYHLVKAPSAEATDKDKNRDLLALISEREARIRELEASLAATQHASEEIADAKRLLLETAGEVMTQLRASLVSSAAELKDARQQLTWADAELISMRRNCAELGRAAGPCPQAEELAIKEAAVPALRARIRMMESAEVAMAAELKELLKSQEAASRRSAAASGGKLRAAREGLPAMAAMTTALQHLVPDGAPLPTQPLGGGARTSHAGSVRGTDQRFRLMMRDGASSHYADVVPAARRPWW